MAQPSKIDSANSAAGLAYAQRSFQAMGSPCEVRLYAEDAARTQQLVELAEAEVRRLETKYSRYREDSETSRINRSAGTAAGVVIDAETASLLDYARTAHEQSDGLFDITCGALRRAWRFDRSALPDTQTITSLLPVIGWQHVRWQRPNLHLPWTGMELDFGGVVKEYAVDAVVSICQNHGCRHGLVDLGGDIGAVGPHPDGSPWRVGIRDPWDRERTKAVIKLTNGGLATSGDYERCIEVDGQRYGHILDPRSGWPVQSMVSVSVQAPCCVVAGTAATIGMLRGRKHGPAWLAELGLPHLCIDQDASISAA